MHTVLKHFIPKQKALLFGIIMFLFLINKVSAQVLVAGTQFTPGTITAGKTFYGINDQIQQYGMIGGTFGNTPTLATSTVTTPTEVFNNSFQYAITTNPDTLDNKRYENTPTATSYMYIVSPPTTNPSAYISYSVSGLVPNSNVSFAVTYCNVNITTNGSSCGYGASQVNIRGIINPASGNEFNGTSESTISTGGACNTVTFTQSTGSSTPVNSSGVATLYLTTVSSGPCVTVGISKIEVTGIPQLTIASSQGTSVCAGEQSILTLGQTYSNSTYQWQQSTNGGSSFSNISGATNNAYLATAGTSGTSVEYQVAVTYNGTTITSSPITLSSISCCGSGGGSRQTVYYNDFGTFDLTLDPTGKTYLLWNYANYLSPVQETLTTTTPFQYPLATPPPGTTYISGNYVDNDQYTVAAGMNGYANYTYPGNGVTYTPAQTSDLQWAGDIGGLSSQPEPGFDHSGNFEGAALFINVPPNSKGDVIFSQTISNLCPNTTVYFQAYMNVFTSGCGSCATYYPVNVQVKLIDGSNATNFYAASDSATAADKTFPGTSTDGCGCWVPLTGQLTLGSTSTSMIFELVQNQNDDANGDDLVLDDITVSACAPPTVAAVFNQTTLTTTTTVCSSAMNIYALASTALTYWSAANQQPLDYLFQYSYTPSVSTSWTALGSVQNGNATYTMAASPDANPVFTNIPTGSTNVYFRAVVGPKNTLNTTTNYGIAMSCYDFSVSPPISASILCPAPIKLISFNGIKNGSVNTLTWSTAMEENNSYFTLQRSSDGKNFTNIATIKGQGNSNIVTNYSYNDNMPLSGVNYYRLQQTDFNGTSTYSDIIAVYDANSTVSNSSTIVVYPNPNNGTFDVSILNPGQSYTLEVIDVQGRQVYYNTGSNAAEAIKVSQLSQGLYIVKVTTNNNVITQKVVVY